MTLVPKGNSSCHFRQVRLISQAFVQKVKSLRRSSMVREQFSRGAFEEYYLDSTHLSAIVKPGYQTHRDWHTPGPGQTWTGDRQSVGKIEETERRRDAFTPASLTYAGISPLADMMQSIKFSRTHFQPERPTTIWKNANATWRIREVGMCSARTGGRIVHNTVLDVLGTKLSHEGSAQCGREENDLLVL